MEYTLKSIYYIDDETINEFLQNNGVSPSKYVLNRWNSTVLICAAGLLKGGDRCIMDDQYFRVYYFLTLPELYGIAKSRGFQADEISGKGRFELIEMLATKMKKT